MNSESDTIQKEEERNAYNALDYRALQYVERKINFAKSAIEDANSDTSWWKYQLAIYEHIRKALHFAR